MSTLLQWQKTASGNLISPKGRLSYPSVFKPAEQENEDGTTVLKYQATLCFPKNADHALILAVAAEAAVAKWGTDYKAKYPKIKPLFFRTSDYPKIGIDAEAFPAFIRTANYADNGRPHVVNALGKNVSEDNADQVYPGRWARLSIKLTAYTHKKGGMGYSLYLQNVQLLEDDEPLAARRVAAEEEFEAIEGAAGEAGGGTDALFQ